ncbi:YgaP family membrane protein [Geoglobus sp.]
MLSCCCGYENRSWGSERIRLQPALWHGVCGIETILIFTAATGFCALYKVLGIKTRKESNTELNIPDHAIALN